MDNFRGGKFIVGTDIKAEETKRMANELLRNQNENARLTNETTRINTEIGEKNSLFGQMGVLSTVIIIIIILSILSLLAYQKATENQSLVNLDNIRRLNLTDLTVYEKSNLNTLTLTGDTTSSGGATYNDGVSVDGGLSVGTKSNFYGDIRAYGGVSVQGGLSVDGATNFYGGLDIAGGVSIDAGLSVGTTSNLYGDVISHSGLSVIGGLSVDGATNFYGKVDAHDGVSITGDLFLDGKLIIEAPHDLDVVQGNISAHTGQLFIDYIQVKHDGGTTTGIQIDKANTVSILAAGDIRTTSGASITSSGIIHAQSGVSIDAGLSVGTTSNLYGEVHAYEGVSIDGGLSVNGVANFYNDLEVSSTAASTLALRPSIEISSFSDANDLATSAPVLKLQKSATDALNSFSATAANEVQGRIEGYGVNTASGVCLSSYIEFSGDAAPGTDSVPGKITFATSDADDAGAPTVRMTLDDAGKLGIGVVADEYIDEKDNLVVGSTTGNTGMTIVSGATAIGTIQFRSNTSVNDIEGTIDYSQNSKSMRFLTNGLNTRMTIDSAGAITIPGTVTHKKVVTVKTWSSNRINIDTTESGSMITIPVTGANSDIGLPVISSSLSGWFITLIASADNGAHTITIRQGGASDGSGTLANTPFYGILLDDTPNSLTGTTSAVIQSSSFKKGDSIDLLCDGTNYIITARMVTSGGIVVS